VASVCSLCSFNDSLYTVLCFQVFLSIFYDVPFVHIEIEQLRTHLSEFSVHQYEPTLNVISKYKDGGVAIVDQWICTHAR